MKTEKKLKVRTIIFLIMLFTTYIYTLSLLEKINININDNLLKSLVSNSSYIKTDNVITYNNFKKIFNFKPNRLLSNNLVYVEVKDELVNKNEEMTKIPHQEETINKDPIVYIYNTHQTETYSDEYLAEYSITPNVMIASYMLKENLEEYGIYSYVEEDSVKDVLNKNKWKYAKSYTVTKKFMEKRSNEIPTFKYYIDLHRDSVNKKYTTVDINGVSYAKIMLLIGLEHDNYKENLKEAEIINKKLNTKYSGISRGIYKKSGKGVNGIYNQDFSKYVFLFEVGSVDNNISEVNNSIMVLAEVLAEYIKEKENGQY